MDAAQLTIIVGIISQFLFEYVPGFVGWYQAKGEPFKRLFMLGLMVLTAVVTVIGSCYFDMSWMTCDSGGILATVWAILEAAGLGIAANQSLHLLAKKS